MKNLDLREKYYYNLKNALIYPLKNSDGCNAKSCLNAKSIYKG